MGGALTLAAAQHAGIDCGAAFYGIPGVRDTWAGVAPWRWLWEGHAAYARQPAPPCPRAPTACLSVCCTQPEICQPEAIKVPIQQHHGELDAMKGFSDPEVSERAGAWVGGSVRGREYEWAGVIGRASGRVAWRAAGGEQ